MFDAFGFKLILVHDELDEGCVKLVKKLNKIFKSLVRNMGVCHERERTEYALTCCVMDDGLAHRKHSSGRAYKPPTGA